MVDNPEGRGQQYYNITATLCNFTCVLRNNQLTTLLPQVDVIKWYVDFIITFTTKWMEAIIFLVLHDPS